MTVHGRDVRRSKHRTTEVAKRLREDEILTRPEVRESAGEIECIAGAEHDGRRRQPRSRRRTHRRGFLELENVTSTRNGSAFAQHARRHRCGAGPVELACKSRSTTGLE